MSGWYSPCEQLFLHHLPQIGIFLLEAVLEASDLGHRSRELFIRTFARERLSNYFSYQSDPRDQYHAANGAFH